MSLFDRWFSFLGKAPADFQEVMQQCRAKAKSWVTYSGAFFFVEPMYREIHECLPVTKMTGEAKPWQAPLRYGLDEQGRPVIGEAIRQGEVRGFHLFEYTPAGVEEAEIWGAVEAKVGRLRRLKLEDGRIVQQEELDPNGCLHIKDFIYDGGKVVAIDLETQKPPHKDKCPRRLRTEIDYDEDGNFDGEHEVFPPGSPYDPRVIMARHAAIKKAFPDGASRRQALEKLRQLLLKDIPVLAEKAAKGRKVYAVLLAYDDASDALPPMVAVGLESEREAWVKKHGTEARDYMWNPAEFSLYEKSATDLPKATQELAKKLQLVHENAHKKMVAFLNEVAAELAKGKWPAKLKRTDDFVVAATDLELVNFRKNLAKSTAKDTVARLKKRNLL